jgi:hypothetical protein
MFVMSSPGLAAANHQHDFDFEFGSWTVSHRFIAHPLSGSHTWIQLRGTSVVRKVWNGRANLGEFEVGNGKIHIEGISLRLYDPKTDSWNIYWSNSKNGSIDVPPMAGRFAGGRGEFYDRESYEGRMIRVRFVFSNITPTSFRLVQSFSADDGKSWEPNWITTFLRVQ